MITLTPNQASLSVLREIYTSITPVQLNRSAKKPIEIAADKIAKAARGEKAVYGVNTGFGKLAHVKIKPEDTATLQRNLILSHCCGVGETTEPQVTRLMMALKLLSLGRGASGVRWVVIEQIEALFKHNILPLVPAQGSVGASGDLAPLAHMAATLFGEGQAIVDGEVMSSMDALNKFNIKPLKLSAKEGLALINGTQFSTAYALANLFDAWTNVNSALITSSLSLDAIMGSTAPLYAEIHELRGHQGQIDAARTMRDLLDGSVIRHSHLENDTRVQDPYCIRCQPQVVGACIDQLRMAAKTLTIEANAVTDNPLVLSDHDEIVSGGNFHAEPVALAADQIALAISEIGAIAQRRIAMMVDPTLSYDLPAFLAKDPGLNSGMMIAEVTSAALMSENKHLANPCSTDSTPTSANQEDHVSMAAHGARRLTRMNKNLSQILGIELLCAAEGVEFRAPLKTSAPLEAIVNAVRKAVPPLDKDRFMAPDLQVAAEMIASGEITNATSSKLLSDKIYE